jgi:hypothetical protein
MRVLNVAVLALVVGGCTSAVRDIDPGQRWSVAPSAVEDTDIRRILARLPATVACIHNDRPERFGIHQDDYIVSNMDSVVRKSLFSDGPLVVDFESWESDDRVVVKFWDRSPHAIGVIDMRRRGRSFVPVAVGLIVIDYQ